MPCIPYIRNSRQLRQLCKLFRAKFCPGFQIQYALILCRAFLWAELFRDYLCRQIQNLIFLRILPKINKNRIKIAFNADRTFVNLYNFNRSAPD